jgi:hypothetical protein
MAKSNIPQSQLDAYAAFVKEDYFKWSKSDYQDKIQVWFEFGSAYIKVVKSFAGNNTSVHSFIVNKAGKFPLGAILKAAGWKAPATNFARADIAKTDSWNGHITWTGAH